MEDRREVKKNEGWLSVPQFGDWEHQGKMPDYSMDFTNLRAMRKQNKKEISSKDRLGNEEELIAKLKNRNNHHHHHHRQITEDADLYPDSHSPTETRKRFLSFFTCCVKA